jgi:TonB family protein
MAGPAFFAEPSRASAYPSFLWEVPGKPVVVRIALDLVDRLETEVVESFRSLTSRGSEIGGLLLGTVHGNNPFEVAIQDYEPVPCDYTRGPLYRLSPADLERFEQLLAQRTGTGMRAAGFFRSHTRKGLSMDADDAAVFNRLFPNMYQVALLAKPFATKPTLGGIFIREEGSLRIENSYKEFPFRRSELERAGGSVATLKGTEKTAVPPAPAARSEQPPPPRTVSRAQIVPIASRREVAVSTVQPVIPAAAEAPVQAAPHAPVADPAFSGGAADPVEARASIAPLQPESQTEPQPVASQDRKASSRTVESGDWLETFDFEKLLREGQEKAQSAEPLHKRLLQDTGSTVAEPTASATAVRALSESVASATPQPAFASLEDSVAQKLRSPKLMWIAGGFAAALIILSGLLVFPGVHRTKRSAAASSADVSTMSLRVERSAGELLLTWNRDSDVIRGATHAVLSIADGERHENVDLDLAQLRNGSIVYSPSSSDIVFQLSVTGKNSTQTQSESVRVLRTRPSPMPEPPPTSPSRPVPTRTTNGSAAPPPPAAVEEAGDQARSGEVPSRPAFQTDTLAQRLRPQRPTDLPDAPGLNPSGQQFQTIPLPVNPAAPVPPPPPPAPVQVIAPPPAPQQPRVGGQVREAQIVTQTSPEYPLAARQARVQGSVVISAVVGADGHIKSAKPISGPPLLQNPAAAAVKQWVYKPATLNGIPVESETRIELNFTLQR